MAKKWKELGKTVWPAEAAAQAELHWNMLTPWCHAAECALLLWHQGPAAVSVPVGSVPRRGASLLTDRKAAGKQGEEYRSKKEKVKKEFNYLPWDRHKGETECMIWRIPYPLSNAVTEMTGDNGDKFVPNAAGKSLQLPPCRILGFLIIGQFTWCWACDDRHGVPVAKQEKNLCTGVFKAHWKSFRLNLKGKGTKPLSLEISLGVAH